MHSDFLKGGFDTQINITLTELRSVLHNPNEVTLYDVVSKAVSDGILSPVKKSGTNGNFVYPLYLKYHVLVTAVDHDNASEILSLHPLLLQSGILQQKPDLYTEHAREIRQMNAYLFRVVKENQVPVSRKERSFEIFGDEKALDHLGRFFNRLGLSMDVLMYYDTPEDCFHDYIPIRKDNLVLLVCENKDIWFNIRRRMFEDNATSIFGVHIDGIVYGEGNNASAAGTDGNGSMTVYTKLLGIPNVFYLYWGDIDRAGFDIYMSIRKNNPTLNMSLFKQGYMEMLRLAEGRNIPDSDDHRTHSNDYKAILQWFGMEYIQKCLSYLDKNKRVPQEIITYQSLLTIMR